MNKTITPWGVAGLVLLAGGAFAAGPWYVSTNGAAPCDGSSWATAFTNVQQALDSAQSNDTIYVAGQTFVLPVNSAIGKLVWTQSWVTIDGGYAADGGTPGARTNTPTIWLNDQAANSNYTRVLYMNGVTNGRLMNVTIQGGEVGNRNPQQAGYQFANYGGGVYATGCTNLTFDTVTLSGNFVGGYQQQVAFGFGMFATGCYGVLTNCVIRNNTGYGLWSPWYGGGLHLANGGWVLRDCVIRDNHTIDRVEGESILGMGVYINGGTHVLDNCLITRNYGYTNPGRGEGLYVAAGSVAVGNTTVASHPHEGIRRAGGTVSVTNCIVWGNSTNDIIGVPTNLVSCTDIGMGDRVFTDNNNLSVDPLFERGFYLAASSPCINTGNQSAATAGLAGYTTRADGTIDDGILDLGYHAGAGVAFPELYVSVNSGSDTNAGTSEGSAFKTVGKAIAVASDGTHINIAAGLYSTNTEVFPWTVSQKYGIQLLATNAGITLVDLAGADARGLTMILSYPDAIVQNLTVANANWSRPGPSGWGAAGTLGFDFYLEHVQGVVVGCTLTNSLIPRYGGGGGQSGYPAGALYGIRSDLVISNCAVSQNTSISAYAEGYWAAGIVLNTVNGSILNCVISSNVTTGATSPGWGFGYGSGLYLSGQGVVRNCLISDNSGTGVQAIHGQGVYVGGGDWRLENCTIVSNALEGLYRAAGTVEVINSILWDNGDDVAGAVSLAYSDIEDGDDYGVNGCISNNPVFTNGVSLARESPCVNMGTNLFWMTNSLDLSGGPRIQNKRVEMGAYEILLPPGGTVLTVN